MERVQRSVTFGPISRERTSVTVVDVHPDNRPGSQAVRKLSRPKTTGDLEEEALASVSDVDVIWGGSGGRRRQKKSAKSVWAILKEHRKHKEALDHHIERQLTLPVISGEKLKKMRELKERPVELNEEQREQINSKSFEAMIGQYKQLRVEQERRSQGLSMNVDSIQDLVELRNLSQRVHANIEKLKANSLMEAAKREQKQKHIEQSKKSLLMIYQEEDMSLDERIEKNRKQRRRKLIAKFKQVSLTLAARYRKRLAQMQEKTEQKFSAKARLLGKTSMKQFNNLFEAVVFMGYVKETEETLRLKKTWEDVRKCRYLRGYEPEDCRVLTDKKLTEYVFEK
ncbi:uncharacterized protein LOC142351188 isoform X1 [Convolutriloba macropyga]|uniref:uncharacterized protein LOC142351188 isoform X1 n=1 Tax=Convolutriloba macropyga TaxID=536237 RepID=UPI003F524BA6